MVGQEVELPAKEEEEGLDVAAEEGDDDGADDPILTGEYICTASCPWTLMCRILVSGKEMPFSLITEEMTLDMTPEEYTLYFETMATIG